MPVLQSVQIRADLHLLPGSEKAALARIVRAARQVDRVYTNQVWPGTLNLVRERVAAQDPAARSELVALDFFKGPWNAEGRAFIPGVPAVQPIGNFYPANSSRPELEAWMQHLSASDRAQALDSFTAVRRAGDAGTVRGLLSRYVVVKPELKSILAQFGAAPALQRYVYGTADQLDPP